MIYGQSFHDYVYELFFKYSKTKDESGLILSKKIKFPQLVTNPSVSAIIPIPTRFDEKRSQLCGIVFDDSENDTEVMWGIFFSSLIHAACHIAVSNYDKYRDWQINKTEKITSDVISFIEDIVADSYLQHTNKNIWEDMEELNSKFNKNGKKTFKNNLDENDFANKFIFSRKGKIKTITNNILKTKDESNSNKKFIEIADFLYQNYEILPKKNLAYVEHTDFNDLLPLKINEVDFKSSGVFQKHLNEMSELWEYEEHREQKIVKKYQKAMVDLHFDNLVIPDGDFQTYLRIKEENSLFLKKIRNQLHVIANNWDDSEIVEMGNINMQMAIQAIASDSPAVDVFDRELANRGEEAWVVLFDNSASMNVQFPQIKEFIIALSESADLLSGRSDAWAIYGFDNKFTIMKDFTERYNQKIKARLGDLKIGGLSFIPDALELAGRILSSDPRERKYIFLVTDGYLTGYDRIQQDLIDTVKKVEQTGINVIGIGLSQSISKYFRNYAVGTDVRKLVAKFIRAYRMAASD